MSVAVAIKDACYVRGMERLIGAVQELSLARSLEGVMAIVRRAARELTGADGATFVLRDGDRCYYADEDAIAPLWKGGRFPMSACISGWVMLHREAVTIPNIYADSRIPHDAYRPTFVKSLAMVPIRIAAPLGAIGAYWAVPHAASETEVRLLQTLANSTSIALENAQVYAGLDRLVRERTAQLEAANRELEAFNYSVSHDLRAPLRSIRRFADAIVEDHAVELDRESMGYMCRILRASERMDSLIDDLMQLAAVSRSPLQRRNIDLSSLAGEVGEELSLREPERRVELAVAPGLRVNGDLRYVRVIVENLLGNAWKFTRRATRPRIEVGADPADPPALFVRDNGAGFDMAAADGLFSPFRRLHAEREYPGTGIGLATVRRIIDRHGGRIWAEAAPGAGATFRFTLGG